ncbi:MAG: uroporphyrinogen decarboxylase family protein, partial [Kiritimatiellota bacterium]|nr:uroporphyrinogen decarboxylase family protein [Kiritimatiellota bacterium]
MKSSERDMVRELASQVAAIAREPRMQAIKQRWRDVNALRKPDRAPIYCRPVDCWKEIIPPDTLFCRDPQLRRLEYQFRQILYKRLVDDDTPVEEYFEVPALFDVTPANIWGIEIRRHNPDESGGSWSYDPPLKNAADYAKLRLPVFSYNSARTQEALEQTTDILGGSMPVRVGAGISLSATLCSYAAELRGLEQIMMDMIAEPELMHRLMAHLRDGV